MKRVFHALSPVFALLILGLGMILPRLTAMITDRVLVGETSQIENSAVSLTLAQKLDLIALPELDLFQAMSLLSGQFSSVALSEGGKLTETAAGIAAMYPTNYIDADVLALGTAPDQITPMLLTSEVEPAMSGIFWRCAWKEQPENIVWVDDQTGAAVGFRLNAELKTLSPPDLIEGIANFCMNCYPDVYITEAFTVDNTGGDNGKYTTEFVIVLGMSGERDQALYVALLDGAVRFNWPEWTDTTSVSTSITESNQQIIIEDNQQIAW